MLPQEESNLLTLQQVLAAALLLIYSPSRYTERLLSAFGREVSWSLEKRQVSDPVDSLKGTSFFLELWRST